MKPYYQSADGTITLYCGDCLNILPLLPSGSVDAVVTDPPYGIGADEAASKNNGRWGWKYYGESSWDRDRPPRETFEAILAINVPTCVWGGNYFTDYLPPRMGWIAWDKGQRDFSLADFEMAWTSEQKASRCIVFPRGRAALEGKVHPTQKPVEVMRQCIEYLERGRGRLNAILDPFAGSFSTAVACIKTGRKCIGIELSEAYAAIAARRCEEAFDSQALFRQPGNNLSDA